MTGHVTPHRTAVIRLTVIGVQANEVYFDTIVDTGFSGYLTLPPSVIAEMGLPYRNDVVSLLANGIEVETSTHAATVRWNSEQRPILVLALEMPPVLGMALLYGQHLSIDVVTGGSVAITELASSGM